MADVGGISYSVDIETGNIIRSTREIVGSTSRIGRAMDSSAASVDRFSMSISSMAKAVIGALSVRAITEYADAWTTVNNKLINSIKTGETLIDVNERVFATAQKTRTSVEATATLYGRLEAATRSNVKTGEELNGIVTTINKAMQVSGATTAEAQGSLVQLSQAFGAGALRGEEFNSVNEAAPRLMQALADSMGVTRGELKSLAAQGLITSDVMIKAFTEQAEKIDSEFSKMTATLESKAVVAKNAFTQFIGSSSEVTSAMESAGDGIIFLSSHLAELSTAALLVGAAYSGRLLSSLAASTQAKINAAMAARSLSLAEAESTKIAAAHAAAAATSARNLVVNEKATRAAAAAERESMYAAQKSLTAQLSLAQTERERTAIRLQLLSYSKAMVVAANEEAAAIARVAAAAEAATVAQNAEAAATARSTAASRAASVARAAGAGALGLIGGPAGAAMLAAAAIYYLYSKQQEATQEMIDYAKNVDVATESLRGYTSAQLNAASAKLEMSIKAQTGSLEDQRDAVSELTSKVKEQEEFIATAITTRGRMADAEDKLVRYRRNLAIETEKLESMERDLDSTTSKLYATNQAMSGIYGSQAPLMDAINQKINTRIALETQLDNLLQMKAKSEKAPSLVIGRGEKASDILSGIRGQIALESELDKVARARLDAKMKAEKAGVTNQGELLEIQNEAEKLELIKQQNEAREKSASEGKKSAAQQANINNLLSDAKLKTQQLTEQYAELGIQEDGSVNKKKRLNEVSARLLAQQRLIGSATNEQIDALAKEYLAQDKLAAKIDDRITRQKRLDEALKNSYETAKNNRDLQAQVDPMANASINYENQLAALQEAKQKELITEQTFNEQKEALANQYEQNRLAAAEQIYKSQSDANAFIMDSIDALGQASTSTISGLLSGTMSVTEAMQNFANVILNQAVGALVDIGIQYVKNQILGQTMQAAQVATAAATGTAMAAAYAPAAAMASLASFGANAAPAAAGITSTVATSNALALSGMRQYGGPVSADGMYRVNETGAPEIFQNSSGQQYMLPNSKGEVISNSDATSGSGVNWSINVINNASDSVQVSQSVDNDQRIVNLAISAVSSQLASRTGQVSAGLQRGYNVNGRTR